MENKEFEVNGIKYRIIENNKVEVTINKDEENEYIRYSGDIIIPKIVKYEDKEYSVASIGNSAFEFCSDLTTVTITESVTSIGSWAFDNCTSLKSVTITESVASIGGHAFYNCKNLKKIYCHLKNPLDIDYGEFAGVSDCTLYVPAESVELYKNAEVWNKFNIKKFKNMKEYRLKREVKKYFNESIQNTIAGLGKWVGNGASLEALEEVKRFQVIEGITEDEIKRKIPLIFWSGEEEGSKFNFVLKIPNTSYKEHLQINIGEIIKTIEEALNNNSKFNKKYYEKTF